MRPLEPRRLQPLRLALPTILGRKLPEPWLVLGSLLLLQWLALLLFALDIRHDGWLFHQPGTATHYYTTSWLLSGWLLPTTPIGYGWPYLLSPVALAAGPNLLPALPAIVLAQTLVLVPAALLCVYAIGARVGGRLVGYWSAALWALVPFVLIPLWDERYQLTYRELFLPEALGLTMMPEFPTTVALLLAAYLVLRALDGDALPVAALAGVAAGFAVALKPSAGIFLAAPLAAFLLARRWRALGAFAVAVAPALVTLAVWKARGAGAPMPLAAGFDTAPPATAVVDSITRYVDLDLRWSMLHRNLDGLREFLGSVRLLQYLPIAGVLGIARVSLPKAALVSLWFFAYFFIKGASPDARVDDASFLRELMPAVPAYLLLAASIPLLVPTLGPRLAKRFPAPATGTPPWRAVLAASAIVFALVPLVIALGLRHERSPQAVRFPPENALVPIDEEFALAAAGRRLSWRARMAGRARPFYFVFRSRAGSGLACGAAPDRCELAMELVGATQTTAWVDPAPPGRWTYRVGLGANWQAHPDAGGLLALSEPVTVARNG